MLFRTAEQSPPIRWILIPVDANHAKLADLRQLHGGVDKV